MFVLKKLIQALLLPSSLLFILLVISVAMIFFKKKLGKTVLVCTLILYYMLMIDPVAENLMAGLERKYVVADSPPREIKHVVVLGAGTVNKNSTLPPSSRLTRSSLARITEGLRLFWDIENSQLITTGSGWRSGGEDNSACHQMKEFAVLNGADEDHVYAVDDTRDTHEEAKRIKEFVGERNFLLVTSAYHMKRALYIFKKLGLNPIAAPCDFRGAGNAVYGIFDFVPSHTALENSSLAINEIGGLVLYRFLK